MFKLFATVSLLFALTSAIQPLNIRPGFQHNALRANFKLQMPWGGAHPGSGQALSYNPYVHAYNGFNGASPMIMNAVPVQHFMPVNTAHLHPSLARNHFVPRVAAKWNNSIQLKTNPFTKISPLRQALMSQYKRPYNPLPNRKQSIRYQPKAGMSRQVSSGFRPINTVNRPSLQQNYPKYMAVPNYMKQFHSYNMIKSPPAVRSGYQNTSSRPGRFLKQNKPNSSKKGNKAKLSAKLKYSTPEEMTLALKKQMVSMRKLMNSMNAATSGSPQEKLYDMEAEFEPQSKSEKTDPKSSKIDEADVRSKNQKIRFG